MTFFITLDLKENEAQINAKKWVETRKSSNSLEELNTADKETEGEQRDKEIKQNL